MIHEIDGDIFLSEAEVLVCPVNCVGVMGAGLALAFRHRYPGYYEDYRKDCDDLTIRPGKVSFFGFPGIPGTDDRYIASFPTKHHWREKSDYIVVDIGLYDLVCELWRRGISSVAIPALGCGLGGLKYSVVRDLIIAAFSILPQPFAVELYKPRA